MRHYIHFVLDRPGAPPARIGKVNSTYIALLSRLFPFNIQPGYGLEHVLTGLPCSAVRALANAAIAMRAVHDDRLRAAYAYLHDADFAKVDALLLTLANLDPDDKHGTLRVYAGSNEGRPLKHMG